MTHGTTRLSRRVGASIAGAAILLAVAVVPASAAYAAGSPQHEPGLYLSVGEPTQLMRGQTAPDGALTMQSVGVPSATGYNALAAHLPTSSLYAIGNSGGRLLQVFDDGSVERVPQVGSLGGASSAAAFGEGAHEDRMYFVQANGQRLHWINVVTPTDTGSVTLTSKFEPVDMAWNDGYFWGLKGAGKNAKLTRMALDGTVITAAIPALNTTKLGGGDFGAAWTYGNGNLGFVSNKGGSVQLKVTSSNPVQAEIIGYSSGPESNQLDAAMIPAPPGDVGIQMTMAWAGRGTPVIVFADIKNLGTTPASGYQLRFGPNTADSRVIEAPSECVVVQGQFQCSGGSLQPGEQRRHSFKLQAAAGGTNISPHWTGSVELNEDDLDPSNNVTDVPLPAPIIVDMRTDVKARVVDENGDGKATPGEKIEVYVLAMNDSNYTLSDVTVDLKSMFWESKAIDGDIAPGERRTVLFEQIVPTYGAGELGGIMSGMDATVEGATATTASYALMVVGDSITPNPEGPRGDQPKSVGQWDPLAPPEFTLPEDTGDQGAAADGSGATDGPGSGESSSNGQADSHAEGSAEGAGAQASGSGSTASESGVNPDGAANSGGNSSSAGAAGAAGATDGPDQGSGSGSGALASATGDSDSDEAPAGAEATSASSEAQAAGHVPGSADAASVQAGAAALGQTGSQQPSGLAVIIGLCMVLGLALGGLGIRQVRRR